MRKTICAFFMTIAYCTVAPSSATAQDAPRFEVAGAYRLALIRQEFDWQDYQGWAIEADAYIRPQLAIATAVDRVRWSRTFNQFIGESHREYGFLAGVKAVSDPERSIMRFVQIMAGLTYFSSTLHTLPDLEITNYEFVIQPGVGVERRMGRHVSIRASLDARLGDLRYVQSWQYPEWRFGAGVVYRLNR